MATMNLEKYGRYIMTLVCIRRIQLNLWIPIFESFRLHLIERESR
ncbi:MAG: hypothetical protein ACI9R3_006014 [Verrucomicrobiales bacterium]|jgi:hypothetical protein